jgi:hypothetical protein
MIADKNKDMITFESRSILVIDILSQHNQMYKKFHRKYLLQPCLPHRRGVCALYIYVCVLINIFVLPPCVL